MFLTRTVSKEEFAGELFTWAYATENIPTKHLAECFRRAIQSKTDDYPLMASAVNRMLESVLADIQEAAYLAEVEEAKRLAAGGRTAGTMSYDEWLARHNLPANWRPVLQPNGIGAQGYPPASDLYRGPFPETKEERKLYFERGLESRRRERFYDCPLCHDSGWTRIPFDPVTASGPTLVKCECGRAGNPRASE